MGEAARELIEKEKDELMHPVVSSSDAETLELERKIDWDELVKYLEIQKEAFKKLRVIMMGYTREKDWVNIDGQPFLQESGAQAIAGPMGVSITNVRREKVWEEDKLGRYYKYIYNGVAFSTKIHRIVEVEGICTSRDRFFGKVSGKYKEIEEVDERNIMDKAKTNLYRNAIVRVLGLRNIEWGELSRANLNIQNISKVEHTLGGKKTGAAEKAIQEAKEKGEKSGTGYDSKTIEKVDRLVKRVASAPTMDKLREAWETDKKDRESLPKELFEKIMTEKNARKKWLQEREKGSDEV